MEFKGTKGIWVVKHSESKTAFNLVGTNLGGKYKIARFPYHKGDFSDEYNAKELIESKANAVVCSKASELLDALQEIVCAFENNALKDITFAKKLIQEATEI